ncbi:MAG: P-loop NTPase [Ignavibacteriaceae bacterium]
MLNKENIFKSLSKVRVPDLKNDLVTLNMIDNLEIIGEIIRFDLVFSTPASPLQEQIKEDCIHTLKNDFPEVMDVFVSIKSKVVTSARKKLSDILPYVKNTIAIASGKGGVGKSTVAVNIAAALVRDGAKVGLIDADIYGPSIPMMLGVKERPRMIPVGSDTRMLPVEQYGIKLMSIGFLVEDNVPVIWRGPMASGAVKQFMSDVEWEELDYLFFDMPPGTGDIQLTLCQTIPLTGAVIVTTPQEVSLIDARKALNMFTRVNVPIIGVIENMSYFIAPDTKIRYDIFGSNGGSTLASANNTSFLGGIPIDQIVRLGGDKGVPVIYDSPDSEHAAIITQIARNLVEQVNLLNANKVDSPEIEIIKED